MLDEKAWLTVCALIHPKGVLSVMLEQEGTIPKLSKMSWCFWLTRERTFDHSLALLPHGRGGRHTPETEDMDKVLTWLVTTVGLLVSARGQVYRECSSSQHNNTKLAATQRAIRSLAIRSEPITSVHITLTCPCSPPEICVARMLWTSSAEKRNDWLSQRAKLSVQISRPTSQSHRPINSTEQHGVIDNDIEIDCLNPLNHRVPKSPNRSYISTYSCTSAPCSLCSDANKAVSNVMSVAVAASRHWKKRESFHLNDRDCSFEKPFGACGYSQGRDDDLEWEQANTKEKPSTNQWMPPGYCFQSSAFMMVNTSGRFAGQRAQLLSPQLKENDTHCVTFHYLVSGREGGSPGHLNIYIKENNSPTGLPVWNTSGPVSRSWTQVELAISTYWPNFYQHLCLDLAVDSMCSEKFSTCFLKAFFLCRFNVTTPHFLHIKGVEVNAGQTATFHCTVNGEWRDNFHLWLQGIGGREAPMKATKPWNNQRFIGMFDVVNTTKQDSGRYRCIVHSTRGEHKVVANNCTVPKSDFAN
ncbi:hypothetical protein QTP70_009713 [Hemibagrus guttatus]|uniref:Receptor-type tyrosine-protein phosphatase mu n=1 Tax=Hemibagrus guttatus TaxID=175788 RepID=A0AAE0Q3W6_9TELE|nr:hypothetical protein QTP70_009713 [Hemibagrus guttatus]